LKLVRPIAALGTCHDSLLHNAPLVHYTSIKIFRSNTVLVHSMRGMLA
jgi:hypothetical protein